MEPQLETFEIKRKAHVYTLGTDISNAEQIWIVFHGYGQRASRIIQKFNQFDLDKVFVIAPEGINKFYWHDKKREAVATWMTSRHRLDEIEDYIHYLNQVFDRLIEPNANSKKINVLGFSQGTNTMWRWLLNKKPELSQILHWAGEFPPELPYNENLNFINQSKNYYIVGDQDHFIKDEVKQKFINFGLDQGVELTIDEYEGPHKIDRSVLAKYIENN